MFPKKKRVTKKLFDEIIKKGSTFSGYFFNFRYINNKDLPRYAFVVPKKISKKAVERNKLKRRGYSIIREYPILNSMGVFFYKKNGVKASFLDIKNDIVSILKKTKINN